MPSTYSSSNSNLATFLICEWYSNMHSLMTMELKKSFEVVSFWQIFYEML